MTIVLRKWRLFGAAVLTVSVVASARTGVAGDRDTSAVVAPFEDEVRKPDAAEAARLEVGKRILQRQADQIDREASKVKSSNKPAYDLLTAASKFLREFAGAAPTTAPTEGAPADTPEKPDAPPEREGIVIAPPKSALTKIPANAKTFRGHRYVAIQQPMAWHVAEAVCASLGGHLVCVESKEELDFLGTAFPRDDYWIGATDEWEEGKFQWVNGAEFKFRSWTPGEPSNSGNAEHCAYLRKEMYPNWNDVGGDYRMRSICEWDQ